MHTTEPGGTQAFPLWYWGATIATIYVASAVSYHLMELPARRFNRGAGGLHHYAYEVADMRALQAALAARDMPMLQAEPVKGAGNFLCNFLSPEVTRGVLVEYVQILAG